jgi:type IV secretory pathway VirB2 component (pilin)
MRESLLRRRGPERLTALERQGSTNGIRAGGLSSRLPVQVRRVGLVLTTALLLPAIALAQSPWERAAGNLATTFTGPLARSLALVAIVIGGLMFMFGEAGAKRQISGIVFGGGLALFAAQFLTWLF